MNTAPAPDDRQRKEYIGDGVYASFDGFQLWLETSNGIRITNEIALERAVFAALVAYAKRFWMAP